MGATNWNSQWFFSVQEQQIPFAGETGLKLKPTSETLGLKRLPAKQRGLLGKPQGLSEAQPLSMIDEGKCERWHTVKSGPSHKELIPGLLPDLFGGGKIIFIPSFVNSVSQKTILIYYQPGTMPSGNSDEEHWWHTSHTLVTIVMCPSVTITKLLETSD